jgi:aminoglycoside 3-N-acetyltransferase
LDNHAESDLSKKQQATRGELIRQLGHLGVEPGCVMVVHASFRRTGPVEEGPRGLIDALLQSIGPHGTLVMPSMSDWDDDQVFDPFRTPCRQLGVVADTFWRLPGVQRSDSPHSFAAQGRHAVEITAPHPPDFPHGPDSPIGRVHDLDGRVLLLGVNHNADTTIHLAEFFANVPYRVPKFCTVDCDGVPTRVEYREIDHCCRNFRLVGDWLGQRGLERRARIGNAIARVARSRDIVATVVEELKGDPCRFLCPKSAGCVECDSARGSVDGVAASRRALRPS